MCRELKRQGLTKKRRYVTVKRRRRAGAKINQKSPCVEGKRSLRSNGTPLSLVCSQEALKSSQACLTRRGFPKKTTPSKVGDVRQALPLHLEKGEKSNGLQ
jgi:hypothetical protein